MLSPLRQRRFQYRSARVILTGLAREARGPCLAVRRALEARRCLEARRLGADRVLWSPVALGAAGLRPPVAGEAVGRRHQEAEQEVEVEDPASGPREAVSASREGPELPCLAAVDPTACPVLPGDQHPEEGVLQVRYQGASHPQASSQEEGPSSREGEAVPKSS
jgi:hypothetical protein